MYFFLFGGFFQHFMSFRCCCCCRCRCCFHLARSTICPRARQGRCRGKVRTNQSQYHAIPMPMSLPLPPPCDHVDDYTTNHTMAFYSWHCHGLARYLHSLAWIAMDWQSIQSLAWIGMIDSGSDIGSGPMWSSMHGHAIGMASAITTPSRHSWHCTLHDCMALTTHHRAMELGRCPWKSGKVEKWKSEKVFTILMLHLRSVKK